MDFKLVNLETYISKQTKNALTLFILIFGFKHSFYAQPRASTPHEMDSLRQVLKMEGEDSNRVNALHLLSRSLTLINTDEALQLSEEGIALARRINYPMGELRNDESAAFVYGLRGAWEKGFRCVFEGMELSRKYSPADEVHLMTFISLLYDRLNDHETALSWTLKAYHSPLYAFSKIDIGQWSTLLMMSQQYTQLNILDSALFYTQKCIAFSEKHYPVGIGHPLAVLCRILIKQGKYQEALEIGQKSRQNFMKQNYAYSVIEADDDIANVYLKMNQLDSVQKYAEIALEGASNMKNYIVIRSASKMLSDIYAKKNPSKAFELLRQYNTADDTITNLEKIKQVKLMEIKENEKIEYAKTAEKDAKNKLKQNTILGILASVLFLALILYRNNRLKQKTNRILEKTNNDLQLAQTQLEHKNKDLEIEAALERVRSKTMAMFKSDEILDTANVLYEELKKLDFQYGGVIIIIMDKISGNMEHWFSGFDTQKYPQCYRVPYFKHPHYEAQLDAWKNGESYKVIEIAGDLKKSYDENIFNNSDYKNFPDQEKKWMMASESVQFSFAFMKYGALMWGPTPISDEQATILKRFAMVFEQTYTRFLDLQIAEAQAREAQIEAALEKIRSTSLIMRHSHELQNVVAVLLEKLKDLGLIFDSGAAIHVFSEGSKDTEIWVKAPGDIAPNNKVSLPYDPEAFVNNPIILDVWKAHETGHDIVNKTYSFEEKNKYFNYVFKHNGYDIIPEFVQKQILQVEGYTASFVSEKHSLLGAASWSGQVFSETEFEILKRIAKVFEQAYVRFLDLQKAEAQAREAKIEAALERVRAKALAMHNTSELKEVTHELRKQMGYLGQKEMDTCAIHLYAESPNFVKAWAAIRPPHSIDTFVESDVEIPKKGLLLIEELLDNYRSNRGEYIVLNEKEKASQWLDFLKKNIEPESYKSIVETITNNRAYDSPIWWSCADFQGGSLVMVTVSPPDEPSKALLKRFANVFGFAYRRFVDLKQAEALAREAQIEAALEKIRSQSLAMHHSEELREVLAVMFEKLKELNVVMGTVALQFFDEKRKYCDFWVSNDLQHIAKVKLPYDESFFKTDNYMSHCWEAKEKGENIINRLYSFEQKNAWFEYTFAHNSLEDIPLPVREFIMKAPNQITNLIIEKKSALFADNWTGQYYSDDKIDVLKRVAKVFDQAYIRFLDLQKAEAQAREAQIEATLERVRSRSMAMQNSEELNAVIGKIFRECTALDIALDSGAIIIYDKKTLDTKWWMTNREDPDFPLKFRIQHNDFPFNTALQKAWMEKTVNWDYILGGLEKKEWDKFIYSKTDFALLPEHIKAVMGTVEKVYIKASFNQFGCLMLTNLEPLQETQMSILPRFSKVFEQTYTRFLDLQLKEQNALMLIEEKQKLEFTLSELRLTQSQLIQREKLASLGELTAGIAHEIQNPLNFVNNFSEINNELVKELDRELTTGNMQQAKEIIQDIKSNSEIINHHGKRAESIVKGMLEHSRKSTGIKAPTDINKLCDEFVRLSYHGLRAKDKSFHCDYKLDLDPDLPLMNVVPQDIGRVILNIVNNAFQACAEQSRSACSEKSGSLKSESKKDYKPLVSISTKYAASLRRCEISISDNGPGIPGSIKDKIFQPFFTTKPAGQGTGLGLSLSYDIMKAHGGDIKVTSEAGHETEFIIQLPIL